MSLKRPFSPLRTTAIVLSLAAMTALPGLAQEKAQQQQPAQSQAGASYRNCNSSQPSASSVQNDDAVTTELPSLSAHFGPNADAAPQYGGGYGGPGPRRPYGRPTYKDRWTNPDGSTKFAFEAGVGPDTAAGATGHYSRTGVGFSVGVGRNYSRAFGVLLQYNYDHMGVVNSAANNFLCGNPQNCNSFGYSISGATHLWSLTLNPVITFANSHSQWGSYVVAGAGFYRKMTVFTVTDNVFGGQYSCGGNGLCFSNNAIGVNGGFGITYKITPDSNAKIFAEARYVWVDNQPSVNNSPANDGETVRSRRRTSARGYFR